MYAVVVGLVDLLCVVDFDFDIKEDFGGHLKDLHLNFAVVFVRVVVGTVVLVAVERRGPLLDCYYLFVDCKHLVFVVYCPSHSFPNRFVAVVVDLTNEDCFVVAY